MGTPHAFVIAGPTASGKSALALRLAERVGGTVVNVDSMQVYRDLRIVTARPSAAEEAQVPHRLYGHVPAAEAYSAGRFVADVAAVLPEIRAEGRVPILVGGTGLYFSALFDGLSPIPAIAPEIRSHWRAEAVRIGADALHDLLRLRDPETAARLRPSDPQRIVRALEVLDQTGRSLADWQREPGCPLLDASSTIRLVLAPPREAVVAQAAARFEAMIAAGAVEEVRALMALGLAPDLPVLRAVGVRPLAAFAAGELGLAEAVAAAQQETRRYIKRQMTWLNGHMIAWKWTNETHMESIEAILSNQ
jgi:tRNA dimethylallyltransferase